MIYRWNTPMEWLFEKVEDEWDLPRTKAIVEELLHHLDFDTIQDCFEKQMDEDGYFQEREAAETLGR